MAHGTPTLDNAPTGFFMRGAGTMFKGRATTTVVIAAIMAVVAVVFRVDVGLAAAVTGGLGLLAGVVMVRRLGHNHDAAWRRGWTSFALAAGLNGAAAYAYVHVGVESWLTLAVASAAGLAVVVGSVAFLHHRLSRGRAIDVLFEGILVALAIALSLAASSDVLEGFALMALAWLGIALVYLTGVWVLVRALALSRQAPAAPRIALMAVAGYFGVFGLQGVAPLLHLQVLVGVLAVVVAVSSLTLVVAITHNSVDEPFAPVPAKAAGLTRAHVILLVVAIVTAPLVSVVRSGAFFGDSFGTQFAIMILFPLLVVAHLIRQVQERATGEYRAQHDDLTGLPNRVLFNDRLEVALAQGRRQNERIGVMFVDLDRFKRINDSLGHDVGDEVLRQVAYRLKRALREEDTVARLGGDEFAVLLHDAHPSNVQVVGDKLLAAFDRPLEVDGRELPIGTSIGISVFPDDGDQPDALLKNADIAMYRAKSQSRSNLQFYTAEMSAKAQLRLALESALRSAVEREALEVHYQARVSAGSGKIIGFEALVRWVHPTLGDISPAAFIPVAEESGLILELGAWVLREACRQNARWRNSGLIDVPVSVNLSARQFAEIDVEQLVVDTVRDAGLPPSSLELELTESILMRDVAAAADLLGRLRELGVRCSIDDFGTGYSGLSYLAKMPVDTLKIDRSFVAEMSGEGAPIISAVIALARSLNLEVVAEGVENEGQVEALQMLECDQMQGFLYARPLPAPAIERLVRRWHARRVDEPADGGHLPQKVITQVLLAASDDTQPFDDLEAAEAVLSALSDRTPELRSLAAAGLLSSSRLTIAGVVAAPSSPEAQLTDPAEGEDDPEVGRSGPRPGTPSWHARGGYGSSN